MRPGGQVRAWVAKPADLAVMLSVLDLYLAKHPEPIGPDIEYTLGQP